MHFIACSSELETEQQTLREAASLATDHLRERGGSLEERLLNVSSCMRVVVEFGVHRGAMVALTAAQVSLGLELRCFVGFPASQRPADYNDPVEDFNEAMEAVLAQVPTEEIIHETL